MSKNWSAWGDAALAGLLVMSTFGFVTQAFVWDAGISTFLPAWFGYGLYLVYLPIWGWMQEIFAWSGIRSTIFLISTLASFCLLNRGKEWKTNLAQTFLLGSVLCFSFEVSLLLIYPFWSSWPVMEAQIGTPLSWFTNADFLGLSGLSAAATVALLPRKTWLVSSCDKERTKRTSS